MATVVVDIDAFEGRRLPLICASTGQRADRYYKVEAVHDPPRIVGAARRIPTPRRVAIGYLPFSDDYQRRARATHHSRRVLSIGVAVVAVAIVLVLAAVGRSSAAAACALGGFVLAVAVYFASDRTPGSVSVLLSQDQRSVRLNHVAEAFALACAEVGPVQFRRHRRPQSSLERAARITAGPESRRTVSSAPRVFGGPDPHGAVLSA